jgi:hypothetical protein
MELKFFPFYIPTGYLQAVKKCSDARHAISGGMRRTFSYAAVKNDERNEADGLFSTAC